MWNRGSTIYIKLTKDKYVKILFSFYFFFKETFILKKWEWPFLFDH